MSLAELWVLVALVLGLTAGIVLLFRWVWVRESSARIWATKLSLAGFSVLYLLVGMEFAFYFFVIQSDSFGFTLAAQRWMATYWTPVNSLGYRDLERPPDSFQGRKTIFVVGDSIVAGMGTSDYRKRFSDRLQARMGDGWAVVNIARNGWNTADEYRAITAYPRKPDVIILSYYINDIDGAALKHDLEGPGIGVSPPWGVRFLVRKSYLLNFLYWRLYRFRNSDELARRYTEFTRNCYAREDVWKTHSEELEAILDFANARQAVLIVLVLPRLTDLDQSKLITSRVVSFLQQFPVRVVDFTDRLRGRDLRELIANSMDSHPSETLHDEIAAALFLEMTQVGLRSKQAPGGAKE